MSKYEGLLMYMTQVTGLRRRRAKIYPNPRHNPIIWVKEK